LAQRIDCSAYRKLTGPAQDLSKNKMLFSNQDFSNQLTQGSSEWKPEEEQPLILSTKKKVGTNNLSKASTGCCSFHLKMFLLVLLIGFVSLIHVLPIGNNFFDKIVSLDKFVHGVYTQEDAVWENRTQVLRKELEKEKNDAQLLRSEKTSEESSAYQLERKLKVEKQTSTELRNTVQQLKQKVASLQTELDKSKMHEKVSNDKLHAMKDKEMAILKEAMSNVQAMN